MDPVSLTIIGSFTIFELCRLAITQKKRARKNAIKKIKKFNSSTRYEIDKASEKHLEKIDRLFND